MGQHRTQLDESVLISLVAQIVNEWKDLRVKPAMLGAVLSFLAT